MKGKVKPTSEDNVEILELLLSYPSDFDEFVWTVGIGDDAIKHTYSKNQLEEILIEEKIKLEYES